MLFTAYIFWSSFPYSTGTQLDNCFKNTGYKCYRFSSTQYEMLPRILQPPVNTCRYSTID